MLSLLGSKSPFAPPIHPTQSSAGSGSCGCFEQAQFVALGYRLGKFERFSDEAQSETRAVRRWLRLATGTQLKALIPRQFWQRFIKNPEFDQGQTYLWRLYPRTTESGKLVSLQLIKFLSVEEQIRLGRSSIAELGANYNAADSDYVLILWLICTIVDSVDRTFDSCKRFIELVISKVVEQN